jgi:hypothetical protein
MKLSNLERMPDFIIVGAQKCGTSTLYAALKKHPDIFMSTPKELNYFQDTKNYEKGIVWYSSFFKDCPTECIAGESSPEYFHNAHVASRLADTLPKSKLIILLRNPVDRAYSGYWHGVRVAGETLSFERAIEIESQRIANDPYAFKYFSYAYRGHYFRQIEQYLLKFDPARILVLISEEYFIDPRLSLTKVSDFLGISCEQQFIEEASKVVVNEARLPRSKILQRYHPYLRQRAPFCARLLNRVNTKKVRYPPMPLAIRSMLLEHFADSNSKLERLLGRNLSLWNK